MFSFLIYPLNISGEKGIERDQGRKQPPGPHKNIQDQWDIHGTDKQINVSCSYI